MQIQSQAVTSPYSCAAIYRKISDLTHLEELSTLLREKQIEVVPIDSDRCELRGEVMHFAIELALTVSERIPTEEVRYKIEHDMLPAEVSIQLTPRGEEETELVVAMEAELNPFVAGMIQPRLEEAVQYIATMLGQIKYD